MLGPPGGEPTPLDGGITNRNFRVRFGGSDYVLRLPGKDTNLLGIDRAAERLAAAEAATLGIGPQLVHADDECAVTAFVEPEPLDPDALREDPGPVARSLRVFHDSGLALPSRFWMPDILRNYAGLLARSGATPPPAFDGARGLVERIADVLPLTWPVPCHNDLLPGNLLRSADEILIVDWEYAGMGHALFDLGNLAVNNEFNEAAEQKLLTAYDGTAPTPARQAALTLMKIVSDAREAAWGIVQGVISALDFDFDGYAATHFERLDRAARDPQFEECLRAAAA